MAKMQQEMERLEVKGSAGNGLVEITLTGSKNVKAISINPDCVDPEDVEGLQDLLILAFKDAMQKVEAKSAEQGSFGGLDLPLGF